jgi:hypothetical protein
MLCDMEGRHSMDTVPHRLRGKVDLDNFEKAGGTVAAHGAQPDRDDDDDLARQIAPDAGPRGPMAMPGGGPRPSSATRLRYWPTATAPAP